MTSDRDRQPGPPYRDWVPDPAPSHANPTECTARSKARRPADGTGTIFVNGADHDWHAVWQGEQGTSDMEDFHGTEDAVRAWAQARPAATRLIFSSVEDAYVPLRER